MRLKYSIHADDKNIDLQLELQTLKDAVIEFRRLKRLLDITICPSYSQFNNFKKAENKLKVLVNK